MRSPRLSLIYNLFSFLTVLVWKTIYHCSYLFISFPSSSYSSFVQTGQLPGESLARHFVSPTMQWNVASLISSSRSGLLVTHMTHVVGSWHWVTVYLEFFPEVLYKRSVCRNQHTLISKRQGWANPFERTTWRPGLCFLEVGWLISFPTTASGFLRWTCPDSSSGQNVLFSQLLKVLSANSRVPFQELASPEKSQLPPWGHAPFLGIPQTISGLWGWAGVKAQPHHSHAPCSNSRHLWGPRRGAKGLLRLLCSPASPAARPCCFHFLFRSTAHKDTL